jgi:hypothetical protein
VSAADPPPVEPPTITDTASPAPKSADSEKDPVSPREKRKMKRTLDEFLEPD